MHHVIKQMAENAITTTNDPIHGIGTTFNVERLVEQVIDRCVSIMEWQKISPKTGGAYNEALSLAQRNIREHFGFQHDGE